MKMTKNQPFRLSFTVRCFLYPLTLIRTRLQARTYFSCFCALALLIQQHQVQHQSAVYSGTIDAFRQISKSEGFRGLYRGFWVSAFQARRCPPPATLGIFTSTGE